MITLTKTPHNLALRKILLIITLFLTLSACGGGGGSNPTPDSISPAVNNAQGGFQSISNKVSTSSADIQVVIDAATNTQTHDVTAQYAVNAYKIEYITLDSANGLVKVSGLIAIPEKTTPSPILSYQHATIFNNAEAPSFHLTPSEDNPEIALASLGYIVVAADYVGYGSSFGRTHPYLQKKPSADATLDMLQASKAWMDVNNIKTNNQLFMTGYSQGGYVTMAALQDLQNNPRAGFLATSAVMGAGPYDLTTSLDQLLLGINVPDVLVDFAIDLLEQYIIPSNAEVSFERTFLERFFADDRQDDVHNWRPDVPVKLIHGDDDDTVPVESAESTFNTMQNLGADIELIKCTATPSSHRNCILPYINLVVEHFGQLRTD